MEKNVNVTIKDVIKQGKKKNKGLDRNLIEKAYEYAKIKHKNQLRKSGEPYIIHPLHVAYTVADLGLDTQTICAALLHDVVEDTDATYEDIKKNFSQEIAQLVEGVTKLTNLFKTAEEKQAENYKKMFIAMEKDIRVILLKLADRLHNISTLEFLRRDRQIAIAKETIEFYAPIAHKLGMYDLKMKLQDGSFKYLYPDEYKKITEELAKKIENNSKRLQKTQKKIEEAIKKQRIVATLSIETKHIYNIYKKMEEKNINMNQIKDLFALKVITKNKKECYKILGALNNVYKLMPGTFKDYIAIPRNNMYQAIHEIIIGEKGVVLELQICSRDMDKIAKYGIVNYFPYMSQTNASKEGIKFQKKLSGIYDTLELKQIIEDPNEFLNTLKSELLDDEVYVFTPKGDIKVLPKGATVIDFAYHIHNDIGKHIKSCRINSKNMPIITKLENGNIVKVIVSEEECVPKKEWLESVKTAKAKSQIVKMLKESQNLEKAKYSVEILAKDRNNLMLDITKIFAQIRLNILSLVTHVDKNEAIINVVMETRKPEKLDKLKEETLKINGVKSVEIRKEEQDEQD